MAQHDPSADSRIPVDGGAESDPSCSHRDVTALARAFDGAQRVSTRTEWVAARFSTEPFPELVRAVRAFVGSCRVDGLPPERVLAVLKEVTRSCTFVCVDGSRTDRLQDLVLREFLVSYYDQAAPTRRVGELPA